MAKNKFSAGDKVLILASNPVFHLNGKVGEIIRYRVAFKELDGTVTKRCLIKIGNEEYTISEQWLIMEEKYVDEKDTVIQKLLSKNAKLSADVQHFKDKSGAKYYQIKSWENYIKQFKKLFFAHVDDNTHFNGCTIQLNKSCTCGIREIINYLNGAVSG